MSVDSTPVARVTFSIKSRIAPTFHLNLNLTRRKTNGRLPSAPFPPGTRVGVQLIVLALPPSSRLILPVWKPSRSPLCREVKVVLVELTRQQKTADSATHPVFSLLSGAFRARFSATPAKGGTESRDRGGPSPTVKIRSPKETSRWWSFRKLTLGVFREVTTERTFWL